MIDEDILSNITFLLEGAIIYKNWGDVKEVYDLLRGLKIKKGGIKNE